MKLKSMLFVTLIVCEGTFAKNTGVGTTTPASKLSVNGVLSVGSGYTGNVAPANGAIVEGNVGIGTSTPDNKLTISTPDNTFGLRHTNGTIDLKTFIALGAAWLGITTAHELRLETNNASRMVISSGGNVGINQPSPQRLLDMNASSAPVRVSNLATTNTETNVLTIDNAGDVRNVPFNNLLAGPVSLTSINSSNSNYSATGNESIIWASVFGVTINLPVPTNAQIGKSISIVNAAGSTGSPLTFSGTLPTRYNTSTLGQLQAGNRITIFAVGAGVFGNAQNAWVMIAQNF